MTNEELWVTAADPNPLVPHLSGITLRKHLLFAVSCCRLLHDWLIDARSRQSVDTAEAFADGEASLNELESASNRASIAAGIIGGAPARVVSLVFYDIERWHHVARRSAERGVVDGGLVESSITRGLQQLLFEVSRSFVEDEPSERSRVLLTQANLLRDIFGNPFRPVSFDRELAHLDCRSDREADVRVARFRRDADPGGRTSGCGLRERRHPRPLPRRGRRSRPRVLGGRSRAREDLAPLLQKLYCSITSRLTRSRSGYTPRPVTATWGIVVAPIEDRVQFAVARFVRRH